MIFSIVVTYIVIAVGGAQLPEKATVDSRAKGHEFYGSILGKQLVSFWVSAVWPSYIFMQREKKLVSLIAYVQSSK